MLCAHDSRSLKSALSVVTRQSFVPTFTPYANPSKCPAHCRYCSEDLQLQSHRPNSSARWLVPRDPQGRASYFRGLERSLDWLSERYGARRVPLSLSGLEATSDPRYIHDLMEIVDRKGVLGHKTLYTNGSGIAQFPSAFSRRLLSSLDKIELHRDHYDEASNLGLMRFEKRWDAIRANGAISSIVGRHRNVWLVCILSKEGISSMDGVKRYAEWAQSVGARGIIFRQLCAFEDSAYEDNRAADWIRDNAVGIGQLRAELNRSFRDLFPVRHSFAGYYYSNTTFAFGRRELPVVFEESDYSILSQLERLGHVHKLVYYANGNLCNGWSPEDRVLASFSEPE